LKNHVKQPMIKVEITKGLVSDEQCQESVRLLWAHHWNYGMHLCVWIK